MKKVLLVCAMAFVFASFTNIENQKEILKDIDGTLLESYAVIDNEAKTITFTVDANTTVSSALVDGEFKIYLIENGDSSETRKYTFIIEGNGSLSFDSYFEGSFDLASVNEVQSSSFIMAKRPRRIEREMF